MPPNYTWAWVWNPKDERGRWNDCPQGFLAILRVCGDDLESVGRDTATSSLPVTWDYSWGPLAYVTFGLYGIWHSKVQQMCTAELPPILVTAATVSDQERWHTTPRAMRGPSLSHTEFSYKEWTVISLLRTFHFTQIFKTYLWSIWHCGISTSTDKNPGKEPKETSLLHSTVIQIYQ